MSNEPRLSVMVFDLDDTLFAERDYVLSGFSAVDRWLQVNHGTHAFRSAAEAEYSAGHRGDIFDRALAKVGIAPHEGLIREMVEVYRSHEPSLKLFPDARDMLAWAASRYRLALITDGYAAVQRRKIDALGLDQMISCRVLSDDLGREHWKPSVKPYEQVMRVFSGPGSAFVYVGDNPNKDFSGARKLGWRTIRVRRADGEHAGDEVPREQAADLEHHDLRSVQAWAEALAR